VDQKLLLIGAAVLFLMNKPQATPAEEYQFGYSDAAYKLEKRNPTSVGAQIGVANQTPLQIPNLSTIPSPSGTPTSFVQTAQTSLSVGTQQIAANVDYLNKALGGVVATAQTYAVGGSGASQTVFTASSPAGAGALTAAVKAAPASIGYSYDTTMKLPTMAWSPKNTPSNSYGVVSLNPASLISTGRW